MAKQHHEIRPNNLVSFRQLIESEYLGGWDLIDPNSGKYRDFTLTIASVDRYEPERRKRGERVRRFVVSFVEAERSWLCGPASATQIEAMYGGPKNWPGKRVTLYFDESVQFGGKAVGGIRPRPIIPRIRADTELVSQPVDQERAAMLAQIAGRTERAPGSDDV